MRANYDDKGTWIPRQGLDGAFEPHRMWENASRDGTLTETDIVP